jgi:hypothetical protein
MRPLSLTILSLLFAISLELTNTQADNSRTEIPISTQITQHEKQLNKYLNAIGLRESSNNYSIVNRWGYMGRYQFSHKTIRGLGFKITREEFLDNPTLQDSVMISYLKYNKKILQPYINRYHGKTINGIQITESGILAAAHLGGAGGVKKWFNSGGKRNRRDKLGTSIEDYMKELSGYKLNLV